MAEIVLVDLLDTTTKAEHMDCKIETLLKGCNINAAASQRERLEPEGETAS